MRKYSTGADNKPNYMLRQMRLRTGKTYPHSSARQRDRYARQLAAGKIKFAA